MPCISFADISAALTNSTGHAQFRCIGAPYRNEYNRSGCCARELAINRLHVAKHIIAATTPNWTLEILRDLICLVLCWKCQRNDYRRKDKIESAWSENFPGLGLNSPQGKTARRPSLYSLWHKAQPEGEPRSAESPSGDLNLTHSAQDVAMTDNDVPGLDQVLTRSQTARIRASSFVPGTGSTSAPWTLHKDTLDLLSKPIPECSNTFPDGGSIYAVRVGHVLSNTRYVKIGITKGDTKHRLEKIEREHGICLDVYNRDWNRVSGAVLERLEKVVFKDLAFFQRDLITEDGHHVAHKHREYFEVDFQTACETIIRFRDIMSDNGMEAGTSMDSATLSALRNNPVLNFDVTLGPEQCRIVNEDHQHRAAFWNSMFRLNRSFYEAPLPCTKSPGWFWTSKWILGKVGSVTSISVVYFGKWLTAVANV